MRLEISSFQSRAYGNALSHSWFAARSSTAGLTFEQMTKVKPERKSESASSNLAGSWHVKIGQSSQR